MFVASELLRQVLLGVRDIKVQDYETINEYSLVAEGHVQGVQRTAIYLEPRDPLFFQAGGRAVAVYDYSIEMRRREAPEDARAMGAVACVLTSKGVVQCL